jgi:GNAT superfamily N-acetyltransferase
MLLTLSPLRRTVNRRANMSDTKPAMQITTITELPAELDRLIALSLGEEFAAISRLRDEWLAGTNRFDRPGELLLTVHSSRDLVGICGLNRDPFTAANETSSGRVRRLYVAPSYRRIGAGRALVTTVVEHAREHFARLRLRTTRSDADQFYVALGFRRVAGDPQVTHELDLTRASAE